MPRTQTSATSKARKKPYEVEVQHGPANRSVTTTSAWIPKKLGGEYPQLADLTETLPDPRTGKIYIYGGLAPGHKPDLPKPDFHVCDTKNMKFTNLTNSLMYIMRGDPDSEVQVRVKKRLPALSGAGLTLMEVGGCSFVFLFGGHNPRKAHKPSSTLIAIDPERKEWWDVEFEDEYPPPVPRITPVLVAANKKLYIFGGIKRFGANWTHLKSYSIVEFPLAVPNRCKWAALDAPYPYNVKDQVFGNALSLHDGMMILLLPGRKTETAQVDFQGDNIFYFLTSNDNFFHMAKPKDWKALPKEVHWYCTGNFDPLSVLICAWIPHKSYLVPELWRYSVFPNNEVVCLRIGQNVFDLNIDLRHFTLVGDRMFLMGQTNEHSVEDNIGTMCDTYVEVSMSSLL